MALSYFLLVVLVALSCNATCCLGCKMAWSHSLANRTLTVLQEMKRIDPSYCLKDRKDFGFPQKELDGHKFLKAQAISVHRDLIQQIFNLFSNQNTSAAWNKTHLDELCTVLDQQLNNLEVCLMQEMEKEEGSLINVRSRLAVRKYFRGITVYLAEKKYSPCSWEVTRAEIMRVFSALTNWQERLRREEGDLVQ
ncbi:PREDICTED: interferon alpha-1/13-like [Elephantulus edwardii]|uniref:interferon alpha-1/13-like n=1 Tax=Elephantulus edwardii TaxID=28737 RepID=UPI0003F07551|nr:PREDICTED: interferon alpha-1/13-like [Elephantulus edwardii]